MEMRTRYVGYGYSCISCEEERLEWNEVFTTLLCTVCGRVQHELQDILRAEGVEPGTE